MADPFTNAILYLKTIGFFNFLLPFMLSAAIFYGLLRKSKIFGDPDKNITINGVVSLVAAFMVWSYPIIAGVSVETELSKFFMQATSATLVIMIGLIITSMFTEDLMKKLGETLGKTGYGGILVMGILIGVGILISSGLIGVFIPGGIGGTSFYLSSDLVNIIVIMVLLVATIGVIIFATGKSGGGGGGSSK
jgi:hypothetical protein